ncbi:hypothetical protein 1 [Beihai sobemo-like virus 11]|uniref:hypothetical protein 1 n=1 Tax=Beihai sobemo-like virus 11 TaxID=1922682 RepID=UPI00090B93B9|nr:hypothetical protein 1 [Beihai sobemo-like virus 11]APG75693.1 hypothetical protein 1 [Beihai sobemo-like virus 11]
MSVFAQSLGERVMELFGTFAGACYHSARKFAEAADYQLPSLASIIGYVLMGLTFCVAQSLWSWMSPSATKTFKQFLGACKALWKYRADRMQKPITGTVVGPVHGYFTHGAEHYYRCVKTSKLYIVSPGRGRFYIDKNGEEKYEVCDYVHELVQSSGIEAEANVHNGEPALPTPALDKCVVTLAFKDSNGDIHNLGHGHRMGDYLVTNAHVNDAGLARSEDGQIVFTKDNQKFYPAGEFIYFTKNYEKATGNDLGAYKISLGTWAASGVTSFQPSNYNPQGEGRIYLTAYDDVRGKTMMAKGYLHNQTKEDCKAGLIPHTAITRAGYSGTPIFLMKGQRRTMVGIHCGGRIDGKGNYGCSIYELFQFRRQLGLEPKIPLICEAKYISPPTKDRQYDRYDQETPEQREERKDREAMEKAAEEEIRENLHGEALVPEAALDGPTWVELGVNTGFEIDMDETHSQSVGISDLGSVSDLGLSEDEVQLAAEQLPRANLGLNEDALQELHQDQDERRTAAVERLRTYAEQQYEQIPEPAPPQEQEVMSAADKYDLIPDPIGEPEFEDGEIEEPMVHFPASGQPVVLGPQVSREEKERGERTFASRASMPLWVKGFLGVGLLQAANVVSPTGKTREVTDEQVKDLLRCRPQDLAAARKLDPQSLLNSTPYEVYRSYLGCGDVEWTPDGEKIKDDQDNVLAARVGKSRMFSRSSNKSHLPDKYKKVVADLKLGPQQGFKDYVMPPTGPEAVLGSLRTQLKKTSVEPWPKEFLERDGGDHLRNELHDEASKYPLAYEAGFLNVHDFVVKLAKEFDGTKSAGWSQLYRPGNKAVWQTEEGLALASYMVRCRLLLRMAWGAEAMSKMSPEQMFQNGLSDPKVASVKVEPHDPEKAAEARWRVIWGASMIDVLTQGVTCRMQDKLDILSYQDGTGKHSQGAGLGHHPEGIQMIGKHIERLQASGGDLFDADASGWDLSVKRDSILMDAERRIRCYVGPYHEVFKDLQLADAMTNSAHMLVFGEYLFSIYLAGITASGILPTTAQNSFMRAFIARLVGILATFVAGDDLMGAGRFDPEYERKFGPREKRITYRDPGEPIEFTSFLFSKVGDTWIADFTNLGKSCAKLAFSPKSIQPEQLGGVLYHLRDNPAKADLFREICYRMEWPIDQAVAGPDGDCD